MRINIFNCKRLLVQLKALVFHQDLGNVIIFLTKILPEILAFKYIDCKK